MGELIFWTVVFGLLCRVPTLDKYWLSAIYLMGLLVKVGVDLTGVWLIPSLIAAKVMIDLIRGTSR